MRLTLRTLLAYLDDVLEPQATREIGKKIQDSPQAAALVSRMREAMRRRRIGAPDVIGPSQGVDSNLVAQYLDNTLSPEQVTQLENICLESDVMLAEVAACHQILTIALGEPMDVPARRRERFYALGPLGSADSLQLPPDALPRSPIQERFAADGTSPLPEVEDRLPADLPDYLKSAPLTQRLAPAAGVAAVVALSILVLAMDRDLFRSLSGRKAVGNAAAPRAATNGEQSVAIRPKASAETNANAAGAARLPKHIDPVPPPDVPEPVSAMAAARPETSSTTEPIESLPAAPIPGTLPSTKAVKPSVAAATEASSKTPVAPTPVVEVPIQSVGNEGVLLRFEPGGQHWLVQPRRSDVHASETFACLEPYEATFEFDKGNLRATILGETSLMVLPATETSRYGLLLRRGRLLFQPAPTANLPLRVAVQIGSQVHVFDLMTRDTVAGVEVQIRQPRGRTASLGEDPFRGGLYAVAGSVQVADGPTVAAGESHPLHGELPIEASGLASKWPTWLDPQRRTSPLKRYGQIFEKEFDFNQFVDLTIPALIKDSRPKIAELAVRCLSITERYVDLAQALTQSDHEEARMAAADGLRSFLSLDAGNGELVKLQFLNHLPDDEARAVERLLWGYSKADAQDRLASLELVEWLRSPRVEVRELAFHQLVQLTGKKLDYRPQASVSQREPAVGRWTDLVRREGALVKPME